ncbi:MAG: DUF1499 domain-containing protein [Paraglaciecola sp.]|uniref:DUF1499 domain-containing protein n=1 Tax=Paraglaciecola sp. TaxID=1920173 RepID=UPI003297A1C5
MSQGSSRIGTILLSITFLSVLAILIMMFGARLEIWEPIVGFGYFRTYLNPIGYVLVALGVIGFLLTRRGSGAVKAIITTLVGLCILAPMIHGIVKPIKRGPPIHDITTDTNNPPVFLFLDDSREGAKNTLVYAGEKDAEIQKKLYPHIAPIQSDIAAGLAFEKALSIAKDKGWEVVAQDPTALRFEAIARTSVFAFMDDVVVVVTPVAKGSRVDIRSVSRVGRSDQGVNAARVSDFIATFNQ